MRPIALLLLQLVKTFSLKGTSHILKKEQNTERGGCLMKWRQISYVWKLASSHVIMEFFPLQSISKTMWIGILRPDLTPLVELWALLLANFYVCYLLCFMLWKRGLKDSPGIRPPRQMRAVRLSQLQGALGLPIHFHFIFTDKGHFLQPYIPLTPSGVLLGRSTKLTHNLR